MSKRKKDESTGEPSREAISKRRRTTKASDLTKDTNIQPAAVIAAPDPMEEDPPASSSLPFKNPRYVRPSVETRKGVRLWKSLKQILAAEQQLLQANASKLPADAATYTSIEAPPTLLPSKKYCDITGFLAPYTDPKTSLRYYSAAGYAYIQRLSPDYVQKYLAIRRAAIHLK